MLSYNLRSIFTCGEIYYLFRFSHMKIFPLIGFTASLEIRTFENSISCKILGNDHRI